MTKGDFPALRMTIDGGRLVPAGQFDAERLNSYRRGTVVFVRFTEEKDRVLIRKWWAILGLVVKQCDTPWKTKEEASEAIKLSLGIVNLSKTVGGQFMQYPRSLSELEDPELQDALDSMTELLSRLTGVDVATLKKETAHIGAEPEPDQPDSGDVPSSPDTADDPATASSAAADENSASPPAGSSAATLSDVEWLQTAARMLWAATHVTGDTDADLQLLNNQRLAVSDLCPTETPQPTKDKAGSIYRQCKARVTQEIDRETLRKFVAGIAGMEEKDLEG
ncbi:hypothetical protein [Neorhizobium tomejilense]|uniref:hypothetical protein n=1 Tax=Neorhizobium tomejilense TaxID=2093828 RepID=UPI000CF9CFAE|nr:hypothetical protein [Neorhizobium tomejilense]